MNKKKNILIREGYVIYNTKKLYFLDDNNNITSMVKIPSYVLDNVFDDNKRLLIKLNHSKNIAIYTSDEVKNNLITVEQKIYDGTFRGKKIKYNLTHIEV